MVLRLPGGDIRHHCLGHALVGLESLIVKGHQLVGNGVVGEFQSEVGAVFGVEQVAHAHIALIPGVGGDQLEVAAVLAGKIAGAVGSTGGNAHKIIGQGELGIQKRIQHAAGKNRPQGAALQDQTGFHV